MKEKNVQVVLLMLGLFLILVSGYLTTPMEWIGKRLGWEGIFWTGV